MPKLNAATLLFPLLLLSGCASSTHSGSNLFGSQPAPQNLSSLQSLSAARPTGATKSGLNNIRRKALEDTALTLGAQAGLASEAKKINASLTKQEKSLSRIFNFTPLILDHNVLPPVLVEGRTTLNLPNKRAIRISDRTYKILRQARFVTTPPNWRNYLWLDFVNPDMPDNTLLPKNGTEQDIWDHYVTKGWDHGIRQAKTIFADNLARLKQDYTGMVRYRKLLAQGMVSKPYVAKMPLGITGDDTNLRINDAVLRITALPNLNQAGKKWRPALSAKRYSAK